MAKRRKNTGQPGANAQQRIGAWRGFSPGEYGVNLQYGVNNPPPSGNLGQSWVTGMPVGVLRRTVVAGVQRVPPQAQPIGYAAGNPDDVTDATAHVVKSPIGRPRITQPGYQESTWRGGQFFANDKLITRDRHAYLKRGNEVSGRDSGFTDPPMDGPARPSLKQINRTINYQQGTDTTAAQDDLNRPYVRNSQGMYLGTLGDPWNVVYGGTPGMWQPYGTYAGYGNVPVQGIQSPVAQGSAGDGPQSLQSGPPHGLHSPTLPDYAQLLGYYMAVPQMRAPRIDRPSNSTIGGQSYSQTVIPQGQTGTIAQNATTNAGINWATKRTTRGWRGQSGAGNGNW